jgi:hypothetical protein
MIKNLSRRDAKYQAFLSQDSIENTASGKTTSLQKFFYNYKYKTIM